MARMRSVTLALVTLAAAIGCGGGEKRATEPETTTTAADDGDDGDVLIPEEKFDEIRNVFERKVTHLSRCHPAGVEAGEVGGNEKVTVTVGMTIQEDGRPTDLRILERSKKSPALEACVLEAANRWMFPSLPKPLETSHIYVLQNF